MINGELENVILPIICMTDKEPRLRAKLIIDVLQSHGFDDITKIDKQWEESLKFMCREDAFEEQRLRDEVKYWKDKCYED